jgi:hypothetical protein
MESKAEDIMRMYRSSVILLLPLFTRFIQAMNKTRAYKFPHLPVLLIMITSSKIHH